MAWSALCKAELVALSKSWVLRGAIVALALAMLVSVLLTLAAGRTATVPASGVLSVQLSGFLFIGSLIVIIISAGSVSHEAEIISDSILSRACTRGQYIAAKLATLVAVLLGVYLLSASIAAFAAWRYASNDMTLANVVIAIVIVGLALLLLINIGVATSVVCNNTVFAVIVLVAFWYVATQVFGFVGAEYLSPTNLARNLPTILKDANAPQVVQLSATPTSLTLVYSKDMDAGKAERVESYAVECPAGTPVLPATAAYDQTKTSVLLGGLSLPAGDTVKVTVRDVTDRGGSALSPAADSATATVAALAPKPSVPGPSAAPAAPATVTAAGTTAATATPRPARPAARPTARGTDRTPPRVVSCTAASSSLQVVFSKALDPDDAEKLDNYIVESPVGTIRAPRAASYTPSTRTTVLSGLTLPSGTPVKVTVKGVHDTVGNRIAERGSSATWTDVTTWHYVLGFGIPALLAGLLAVVWFSRRDL